MPWKECRKMDEKLRFVSRFLARKSLRLTGLKTGMGSITRDPLLHWLQ